MLNVVKPKTMFYHIIDDISNLIQLYAKYGHPTLSPAYPRYKVYIWSHPRQLE